MEFVILSLLTFMSVGISILVLLPVVAVSTPKGSPSYVLAFLAAFLLCYAQLPFLPTDPNDMSWDSMGHPVGQMVFVSGLSAVALFVAASIRAVRTGVLGFVAFLLVVPAAFALLRQFWCNGALPVLTAVHVAVEILQASGRGARGGGRDPVPAGVSCG